MSRASELIAAGDLQGAIAAQTEEVKRRPRDVEARGRLGEYLCVAGALERADAIFEAVLAQAPDLAEATLFRQLIRAETWRQQLWIEGRPPELRAPADETIRRRLAASIELREGAFAAAKLELDRAAAVRIPRAGARGGVPFDDFTDLDERLGDVLEVLTATGKHLWIPLDAVEALDVDPQRRAIDLAWCRARLALLDGTRGTVFVPTTYAPARSAGDEHRLGRRTDWLETGPGGPVCGLGQRVFLVGDEDVPLLELGQVVLSAARPPRPAE